MRLAVPTRGASVKGDEKMVAVSETGLTVPVDLPRPADGDTADDGRRVVAIAVSPMELLRPGSDLLDEIRDAGYVDLLLVCEDEPVPDPSPVCVLGGGALTTPDAADDLDDMDDDATTPTTCAPPSRSSGSTSCTCIAWACARRSALRRTAIWSRR